MKFKYSKNWVLIIEWNIQESSFSIYASKLNGNFNWICLVFDSIEQYEIESINFLNWFGELISDYRRYESMNLKLSNYSVYNNNLEDTEGKIKVFRILNSLKKYNNLTMFILKKW